ncbi:hypothetical protein [Rhizobium bangladeshense]|uniref:hypothetical protein n=1 Tax=Rhizobium bangladeshense TaxID=1138189 RepID=UPI001C82F198|nr:hypothetical protein [Rhizobium bangladeshense]MBX4898598.1 hypothetical protein [Rhizobium bangladeshense]MBY3616621.1 hypothetical protein [Rhizobium bangladeshense]
MMPSESYPEDVVKAAQWLADQKEPPAMVVPTIRQRFSLSALEAAQACALAQHYRTLRRAFG